MKKIILSAMLCGGFLLVGTNANAQLSTDVQTENYVKEKQMFKKLNPNATNAQVQEFINEMAKKYPNVESLQKQKKEVVNSKNNVIEKPLKVNTKPSLKGQTIDSKAIRKDVIIEAPKAK